MRLGADRKKSVHPRLWWVLAVAIGVLLLFLVSFVVPNGQAGARKPV